VESYVDDVVIKTENSENFIEDLQLVFNSLRRYQWKLNSEKCVFEVPARKLLGFIVSHQGIEANPEKIEAVMRMEAPRSQKKVQRLTGCMAALRRIISRLGEKGMPFYKLLKKVDKFQWTTEAQEALEALKKFLTTPPVLKPPRRATPSQPAEDLLLYISCTTHVVSTALVVDHLQPGRYLSSPRFFCHVINSSLTLVLRSLVLCSSTSRCILINSLIVVPLGCLWVALRAIVGKMTNFTTLETSMRLD
jgi:hypothetical protein